MLGDEVVLFGGYDGSYLGDTWTFDGMKWRQVNTSSGSPSARQDPGLGTVSTNQIVLFGGTDTTGVVQGDTWSFDGSTWTELSDGGAQGPSARTLASIAGSGVNGGSVVLFGGDDGTNMALGDTWDFGLDGNSWSQDTLASNTPPGRSLAGMSPIVVNGANDFYEGVVLFGGDDVNGNQLSDTWTYAGLGAWSPVSGGTSPPPRDGPAMAFLQ
jgi:galactose oxidase-like protein